MRVDKVGTDAIHRYIADRQDRDKAKNGTVSNELALLRRAFNLAHQAEPPKVARVPRFPLLKEDAPRAGFFEHDQYQAMFQALREDLRPVLCMAYYTGCRRGEIINLQWSSVDLEEGLIRLNPGTTKNKEGRMIPLSPELRQMIATQKDIRDRYWPNTAHVFFWYGTGGPLRDFHDSWHRACKKAGLVDENGKHTRLFHDLRRTGVRNLVRAGVSTDTARKISGHKTLSVFSRYNIVDERDLKEAALRLSKYVATKVPAPAPVDAQRVTLQPGPVTSIQ